MTIKVFIISFLLSSFFYSLTSYGTNIINTNHDKDTSFLQFKGKILWWFYDKQDNFITSKDTKKFFSKLKRDIHNLLGIEYYDHDEFNIYTFLIGLTRHDIIKLLGRPDLSENKDYKTSEIITYYIVSFCGQKDADCCWISIYFDEDNKVRLVFPECT